MITNAKIKVIKKGTAAQVENRAEEETKTTQQAAREMVSTVSNWVTDFQQRRRTETKQAIEKFFTSQAQPDGV